MSKQPTAYSYIRFSTAEQAAGDSRRRQTTAAQEYADKHGLKLSEDYSFIDAGMSAYKGKHAEVGGFRLFLDAVENGNIKPGSYLLVESLDRISRENPWQSFGYLSDIVGRGIIVVTLTDGIRYSKDADQSSLFIALSSLMRAHQESQMKSERVGKAWRNKKANADNPNAMKLTRMCPNWMRLSDDRKSFELIPEHVETIRRIFAMTIEGKGKGVITREFNAEGVPTYGRTKHWAESTIQKIITGRAVLGEYQPHKKIEGKRIPDGEPVSDYYPRIIDDETWHLAQSAIRKRTITATRHREGRVSNLFSGLLKCPHCGSTIRYLNKGDDSKGGRYLICINRLNGLGCGNHSVKYDDIESAFLNFVREIDLRSLLASAKTEDEADSLRQSIVADQEAIAQLDQRIQTYLHRMDTNPELADVFVSHMSKIKAEQTSLKAKLKGDKSRLAKLTKAGVDVSEEEQAALIQAFKDGAGDRRKLANRISSLVTKIEIYGFRQSRKSEGGSALTNSYFQITFRDGSVRAVMADPHDKTVPIVSESVSPT